MKLHFISGLPRSGSTLLSAILKQNPKFSAGITSGAYNIFEKLDDAASLKYESGIFVDEELREKYLKSAIEIWHEKEKNKVVFETGRMWCSKMTILNKLYPKAKVIACVREMQWIVDSFERLYQKNLQKPSALYAWDNTLTVMERTELLLQNNGIIGGSFNAFREAYWGECNKNLLTVDYENLCKYPEQTMKAVYKFIGEPYFKHNFKDVAFKEEAFDKRLGAAGLHDVKKEVKWKDRKTILPPRLFQRFYSENFWRIMPPTNHNI